MAKEAVSTSVRPRQVHKIVYYASSLKRMIVVVQRMLDI